MRYQKYLIAKLNIRAHNKERFIYNYTKLSFKATNNIPEKFLVASMVVSIAPLKQAMEYVNIASKHFVLILT